MDKYIYAGILLIILGLTGTLTYKSLKLDAAISEVKRLEAETAAKDEKIQEGKIIITQLQADAKENQGKILELSITSRQHEIAYQSLAEKYNEYKERQNVVNAKPKLVEDLANKATNRVFKDFNCVSGGQMCTNTTSEVK
jgi:chromosome segregation ATPase